MAEPKKKPVSREDKAPAEPSLTSTPLADLLPREELEQLSTLQLVDLITSKLPPRHASIFDMVYLRERIAAVEEMTDQARAALEASTRYLAYDLGEQKIRVNCISAGPVNTLAARGIAGFSAMLKHYEQHAPLKRNVLPDELGATGTFLASDGAAAITGQVLYVDCGYQVMGMTEAPKPA